MFYPAVLGSGLVFWLSEFSKYANILHAVLDLRMYFGLFLIVYFSISFLLNDSISTYTKLAFASDLIEITLIFGGFYSLGIISEKSPESALPHFRSFYFFVAAIPLLQQVWNYAVGYKRLDCSLLLLSCIASSILLMAAIWGYRYWVGNLLVLVLCCGLLWYYAYRFLRTVN